MTGGRRSNVIIEVLSQHADDAAFLWTLREAADESSAPFLSSLNTLDMRIVAALMLWKSLEVTVRNSSSKRPLLVTAVNSSLMQG